MADKKTVDGIVVGWGEKLLYKTPKAKKSNDKDLGRVITKIINAAKGGGSNSSAGRSPGAVRAKLAATVKRSPEVMVKITGGGKSMTQIKAHFDYISRNGKIAMEDQDGNMRFGKDSVNDLRDEWQDGRYVIPIEKEDGRYREAFNIMLAMPPNTDREAVTDSAREFAREVFGGKNDYAFVEHRDKPHPHVHLVVKAKGHDGKRLNPRKADLQKWRELFAAKLNERGIEANATKRQARGVVKKSVKLHQRKAEERGVRDRYFNNSRPTDPTAAKSVETAKEVVRTYEQIAKALASSEDRDDRKLALGIVDLVKSMPSQQAAMQKGRAVNKDRDAEATRKPGKDDPGRST